MRKQIAAANWKMNLTLEEAVNLMAGLTNKNISLKNNQEVVLGVPFPYLLIAEKLVVDKPGYSVAAQNCYQKDAGAFTGETSAVMIASCGVRYVIVGHSERREYFNETNDIIAQKVDLCLKNGLQPIICCGEALEIREAESQNDFVEKQIKEGLFHLTKDQLVNFIVAYEPIWAIGTGKTASADQAQEMHAHIRKVFENQYGKEVSESISILYGGSVKANNAAEIFGKPDVDGGLVGGASMNADEFESIIKSLK